MAVNIFEKGLLSHGDKRTDFDEITLALASPEKIRSWSYGEVRLPETINYRTFKPEKGGLFCAKIFGPIKDYECLCGKYKRMKHRHVICDKCEVEVTQERVRRERMGHINLACPVAHILFFKSLPSRIGLMLDLTMRDIERILYFEAYVVLDPRRVQELERGMLLNFDECKALRGEHGAAAFDVGIGAEGLRDFLKKIDLGEEIDYLRRQLDEVDPATKRKKVNSETKRKKILKQLKLMENFRSADLRPEWMILEALPVLPPSLRPLVQLDGIRFTTSDLNDLYRRVINRNNRLRKLMDLDAPEIIINNEKRMLQEAVDSLLDNGRRGKPAVGVNKRPLKSLADVVKGKTGRFRQNLLGKRVDFSARSVIVVGPNLKLHECGLPKHMALNLFRPFVFHRLMARGFASNIRQARQKVDSPDAEVWDVLEEVIRQHPILLNRAPTLHRLGIQAFEPVLIEGKAIQLHPLVCVAFNADFDGDQMAVHVPLSLEAQAEARVLMLSSNNILSPANGDPIVLPTQDIVLGLYYATRARVGAKGEGMRFADINEMSMALESGAAELQANVSVLLTRSRASGESPPADGEGAEERVLTETTIGRALMLYFLPPQIPFADINGTLKKKDLAALVKKIFRVCGLRETVIFCDKLMRFGFDQATKAGISICMNDMLVPAEKADIIAGAEREIREAQRQFRGGLLTEDERYNKSVDLWDKAGEKVGNIMMDGLSREAVIGADSKETTQESFNSLYIMADSGARGSQTQIKQLAGMRGLMAKSTGRIMETAITANFREGLSVLQYFLATHGARKGLTDTALKTASSGYMTRRLVDVAQDVVIRQEDCGAAEGIALRAVLMGGEEIVSLAERILGRFLAKDIKHPQTGQALYSAGDFIDEDVAERIMKEGVDEVEVRSPVKCEMPHGLCVKCYGRDLARGGVIQQGEAVGVISAQSIGEPGTQLTMRTFHIGGAAAAETVARSVSAKFDGEMRISARYVENGRGEFVVVSRSGEMSVYDADGRERQRERLLYGDVLKRGDKSAVKAGATLFTRDPLTEPVITEHGGVVRIEGLEEGHNADHQLDEMTGLDAWVITEDKRAGGRKKRQEVRIKFLDDGGKPVKIPGSETEVSISLRPGMTLSVRDGGKVGIGDSVATKSREVKKSGDITGGLPRVAELFEAREPKDPKLLAKVNGRVVSLGKLRNKQILAIIVDGAEKKEFQVGKGRKVLRKDKTRIKSGDIIVAARVEEEIVSPVAGGLKLLKGRRKGFARIVVTPDEGKKKHSWTVRDDRDMLKDGAKVDVGGVIAEAVDEEEIVAQIPKGSEGVLYVCESKEGGSEVKIEPAAIQEISAGRNILVQDGDRVKSGDEIVDGDPNPYDILDKQGVEALTAHIVEEVQKVYRLQGVTINDKHIEVIVHQMLRCVEVIDAGESRYLVGDKLVRSQLIEENERLKEQDKKPLKCKDILLGITKASLATDSFISAASFQETTRVMTNAAVSGQRDKLRGLKENVIVGRLIPAGTGFVHYRRQAESDGAEEVTLEELTSAIDPPAGLGDNSDATTA